METCRWCGRELRDVTDPSFGPPPPKRWVHDDGGSQGCWPDKPGSPRAAPGGQEVLPVAPEPPRCGHPGGQMRMTSLRLLYNLSCDRLAGHEGEHDKSFAILAQVQR